MRQRVAFMRIFACEEDWSHESMDAELPHPMSEGQEPLLIIGAIVGGKTTGRGAQIDGGRYCSDKNNSTRYCQSCWGRQTLTPAKVRRMNERI